MNLATTGRFEADAKLMARRGKDVSKLWSVVAVLLQGEKCQNVATGLIDSWAAGAGTGSAISSPTGS